MMQERIRILVIDDDVALVKFLKLNLEKHGYSVQTANDGEEGLQVAREGKPHLIILDMNMPKLRGAGIFAAISRENGELKFPVLVLTAQAELEPIFGFFKFDGFMSKPFEFERLLAEIEAIVRNRYGNSAAKSTQAGPQQEKAQVSPEMLVWQRRIGELAKKAASENMQPLKMKVARARKTVLIVEDDVEAFDRMVSVFREGGYSVSAIGAGKDVIDRVMAERPDLIVIKLWLKDLSGDRVIYELRQRPRMSDIPVLLHTHADDPALNRYPLKAIREGAFGAKCGLKDIVSTDDPEVLLKKADQMVKKEHSTVREA